MWRKEEEELVSVMQCEKENLTSTEGKKELRAKERKKSLEAGKGKETNSSFEPGKEVNPMNTLI